MLVELHLQAGPEAGMKDGETIARPVRYALRIREEDAAKQPIPRDPEAEFGFNRKKVPSAEAALDISSPLVCIFIPRCGRQVEVRRCAAECEPVIAPKGKNVRRAC